MQKKYLFILFCICLFPSCEKKSTGSQDIVLITGDLAEAKTIPSSDWFAEIQIVPLETTDQSLIKWCDKIVLHNDKYYVLDRQQQTIFIFDKEGTFLTNTLSKKGQGPGEYIYIEDFYIDAETNTIELLDTPSYKIRKYDEHFNNIGEWSLNPDAIPVSKFIKLTPNLYAFYSNPTERNTNIIRIYSASDGNIIKNLSLDYPLWEGPWATEKNVFYEYDGRIYFTFYYSNPDLYELSLDDYSISKVLECDFGSKMFDKEVMARINLENYSQTVDPYILVYSKYQNSSDYYISVVIKNDLWLKFYTLKRNKQTGDQELIRNFFEDKLTLSAPLFIDDDFFYVQADPNNLQYDIRENLLDDNSKMILEGLTEDDNPVIVKYRLK